MKLALGVNVCARSSAIDWHHIQGVFLLCTQCSPDRLWIHHHDPNHEKGSSKKLVYAHIGRYISVVLNKGLLEMKNSSLHKV